MYVWLKFWPQPPNCQHLQSHLYTVNYQISTLFFHIFQRLGYRVSRTWNLAVRRKTSSELSQWRENLIFRLVFCSYGLTSVLWIWIWIILDHDLFWLDLDLWKRCGSTWCDFQPRSQIGIRVVAKCEGSENREPDFTSIDSLLKGLQHKTAYF
jgi:hypothetical protein